MMFVSGGQLGGLDDTQPAAAIRTVDASVSWADYVKFAADTDPEKMYREQASLRKVVGFLARNLSVVQFHLYQRKSGTDRQRVTDHTLAHLLANPNGALSPVRFRSFLVHDLALFDRYAAAVVDDEKGLRLALLPARDLSFTSNRLREVDKVRVEDGHGYLEFDPETVVFDHGWNAAKAEGVPPVVTLAAQLRELKATAEYRDKLMRNAVASDVYIERPQGAVWSTEAAQRFKDDWSEFQLAGANAGKSPILEDGMKLAAVPHNVNGKTQDLAARQLSDEQVSASYFVPPEMVGRQGTFSNVDAFRSMLYGPILGPDAEAFAAALNRTLVPLFGLDPEEFYIEAAVRDRLRGTFLEEAAVASSAAGAPWQTRNEIRARFNLPALPGGDELIVPLNVLEGGLASPRDTAPKVRRGAPEAAKAVAPADAPERVTLERAIRDHFKAQAGKIAAALPAPKGRKADAALDLSEADVLKLYDLDLANEVLAESIRGKLLALAAAGAAEVVALYGRPDDDFDPDVMGGWIAKAAESQAAAMNAGYSAAIAGAIVGSDQWRSILAEFAGERAEAQASVWSQTAGTEAWSFGGSDAARWSGLSNKTWQVTSSKPRASHAAMSGETVGLSDTFSNGARWPGDSALDASEVANCTCVVEYS